MNIQNSAGPKFQGYFKIHKSEDEQRIHDLLNKQKYAYKTQRSPEDELVIHSNQSFSMIDLFNRTRPAVKYHHQAGPFKSDQQLELENQQFALSIQNQKQFNEANIALYKARQSAKRKTVLGFIKGCFKTEL